MWLGLDRGGGGVGGGGGPKCGWSVGVCCCVWLCVLYETARKCGESLLVRMKVNVGISLSIYIYRNIGSAIACVCERCWHRNRWVCW